MGLNRHKDTVAVIGVGSTKYGRDLQSSHLALGIESAVNAIRDAGIDKQAVDGICGSGMTPLAQGQAGFLSLQGSLGIERITWGLNSWLGSAFVHGAAAVSAGLCDTCLVVQTYMRDPGMSRSAAVDPYRQNLMKFSDVGSDIGSRDFAKRWVHSGEPYAAWMKRYMHDYGVGKEAFAYMSMNNRSHGSRNPAAVMQNPITLDDYYGSRMIWEPMQILDMDVPVDCAEAHIITTVERARDLDVKPVLIHAMSLGGTRIGEYYENTLGWTENSHWAAARGLWERSDIRLPDVDLFYPYDGYTIDAIGCVEAVGYCKPGEAGAFLESSWDHADNILKLNGKTQVTTHGGGLALGRAGGANFYSEAVRQLRGNEGARQVEGAKTALINIGSFFHDPSAVMLRTD